MGGDDGEPRLAPPGAGLPPVELWVARRLFGLKRLMGTREMYRARFERERVRIAAEVAGVREPWRGERVLVPRLRGLEDSSRYWSVWMVLDHLRITNLIFAEVMAELVAGRVPETPASTAAVKPRVGVGREVEEGYEAACERLLKVEQGLGDLRTVARYAHPWFGPLDAAGWQALAAMHMGIHREQLRVIGRALEERGVGVRS